MSQCALRTLITRLYGGFFAIISPSYNAHGAYFNSVIDWIDGVFTGVKDEMCGLAWGELYEMDADHVTAWSKGGDTSEKNCQMLCKTHNRAMGNR